MKECHNEDAQCAFIVDKISEILSNHSADNCSYGNIAILYRRRVMFLDTLTIMSMNKAIAPYLLNGLCFFLFPDYRYQGKPSKWLFGIGKFHLTFMVWHSTEKRY